MSENNQSDQELLQVEGILDLNENKSGVLWILLVEGRPLRTTLSFPEN